jgi:lysophospholipase L1-like esterase
MATSGKPVRCIRPEQLGFDEHSVSPSDFGWHMLAEGDSWFSFGSLFGNNLLNRLALGRSTLVTSTARPSDTLARMVDWWRDPAFATLIDGGPQGLRAWKFDAILLSGGGNDLIDAVSAKRVDQQLLRKLPPGSDPASPADCIHPEAWLMFERYLRENFGMVSRLAANGALNSATPIFVHTYEYPTPRNAAAAPGRGPWLLPALVAHGIPPSMHLALAKHLIDRLAGVVRKLALANVHVIDTLGTTLTPADADSEGDSNDWLNEIHPNSKGYGKLAAVWRDAIEAVIAPVT